VKKEKIMEKIAKAKRVKISISLEKYIPLKVLIDREDESVINMSCCKDKTSLLEISIGKTSGFIRRITLLLSKEYDINNGYLNIGVYDLGDLKINDELKKSCSYFKTHLPVRL